MSEKGQCESRVLVSCTLCGRLLVIPPTEEALCPDCQTRRRRLLELPRVERRKRRYTLSYLRP